MVDKAEADIIDKVSGLGVDDCGDPFVLPHDAPQEEPEEMIKCPECEGSGKRPHLANMRIGDTRCTTCRGAGEIPV